MSLDIAIKVDPGSSVASIDKVEDALAKVEQRGEAMKQLGPTFTRIAEHMRFLAGEAAKSRQVVDNLAHSFKGVADAMRADMLRNTGKAFEGLTQQIGRERDMLERLHGPAKQFEQDMATLEMLHKRGAISAHEHANELERINKTAMAGGVVMGPQRQGTGGGADGGILGDAMGGLASGGGKAVLGELAGGLAGIAGPAALASAAIGAISDSFDRWKEHTKDTNNATNSILKFHASMDEASAAMSEQVQLSDDLHLNIAKTTKAYADVREATDGLYLSSKQQVDITRSLSAALIADGGSIEGVSAIMEKLRYAQETGVMGARELKSIWQQSPEVANMFAKSIGKTYPELKAMAAAGTVGRAEIEKMTLGLADGKDAMAKYGQRVLNVDEVMQELHVSMFEAINIVRKAKEPYVELADTFLDYSEKADLAEEKTKAMNAEAKKMIQTAFEMSLAADNFRKVGTFLGHMADANAKVAELKTPLEKWREEVKKFTADAKASGMATDEMNKALSRIHPPDWVDYYKQELDAIQQPEKDWAGRIGALDSLLKHHTITVEQYGAALAKVTGHTREIGEGLPRNFASHDPIHDLQGNVSKGFSLGEAAGDTAGDIGLTRAMSGSIARFSDPAPVQRYNETIMALQANLKLTDAEFVKLASAAQIQMWDEQAAGARRLADQLRKVNVVAQAAEDSLKSAAGSFSDTLVDAANGADIAWGSFFEGLLVDMEKAILKAAGLSTAIHS